MRKITGIILTIFILISCDSEFNGDHVSSFQPGEGQGNNDHSQNSESEQIPSSSDIQRMNFETAPENTWISQTEGLFGAGSNTTVTISSAAIKAIKSDGTENMNEITVSNGESFEIAWDSAHVSSCQIWGEHPNGAHISEYHWTTKTGLKKIVKTNSPLRFVINCSVEGQEGILGDSVTVKVHGGWFSVAKTLSNTRKECAQFCKDILLTNSSSPEGWKCASGETFPASAVGNLQFHYGCWSSKDCNIPRGAIHGSSVNHRCYGSGQKHDNDSTDITVGCYCI